VFSITFLGLTTSRFDKSVWTGITSPLPNSLQHVHTHTHTMHYRLLSVWHYTSANYRPFNRVFT